MQIADHLNGEHLRQRWPQQQRGADFSPFDPLLFLKAVHGVTVDRVRDLVAQGPRQLLGVFHEIEQRVDNEDVAARRRERVGMGLVDDEKLEGVIVAGLRLLEIAAAIGFSVS